MSEKQELPQALNGKVVLVTGGTSGIGRAAALALAGAGAKVVVSGRREAEGNEVAGRIQAGGGEAVFVRTDVTREAQIAALVERTLAEYGRLDAAFNNAGVEGTFAPTAEATAENYERIFAPNVLGVLLSMKHEIRAMLASGAGGSIVNNASVAAHVGFPNGGVYAASKHAVVGLTKTAALEYAAQGVRVNAVSPGAIETEMLNRAFDEDSKAFMASLHPVGRIGTAAEVAGAVVYLLSDAASFVTGQVLAVDGGFIAK